MKKLIKIFLSVLVIILLLILYIDYRDDKSVNNLEKEIIKKTDIKNIVYLNMYGEYCIVLDNEYLYVFDKKYVELLKLDRRLLHENDKKYDIIFDEIPMYMNDYYLDDKLYYSYYDIYTYEKIKTILVGG